MADYRFARRPVWIAGHLLVVGLIALMVSLGFWQLRRLDERRDTNALVEARLALRPEPVGSLVDPDDEREVVDALRFRSVTAAGAYTELGTTVRSTQGGTSGARVFSVLELDGGESVAVLRGFTRQGADGSITAPPPPEGAVEAEGVAIPTARLERLSRLALDELAEDAPGLLPVVVQASETDTDALVPVPPTDLGEGPHLSYAAQWFLFAAVGAVGYPFLLRRRARDAAPETPEARKAVVRP